MSLKRAALILPLLAASLFTSPVLASTMPKAEADQTAFVIAAGPSAALDLSLQSGTTLGISAGLPFLVNGWNDMSSRYDLRLMLDIYKADPSYEAHEALLQRYLLQEENAD